MYIMELRRHLTLSSVLRWRSAVRHPDGRIMTIQCKGYPPIQVRRCGEDLETVTEILWDNIYEPVFKSLRDCRVFVDLGANIGIASVLVQRHFPKCRVLALEPHPGNFELLKRNAPFAECHQAGAWSTDGTISLSDGAFNAFRASEGGTIPAMSMKTILGMAGQIDLLKIDIEGSEVELFKNPEWLDAVKVLAIEFHGDSRSQCRFDQAIGAHGLTVIDDSKNATVAVRK